MNATELYQAGKLQAAIDAQIKEVKSSPMDDGKRLFLFELFAFAGDLEKAKAQIAMVKYDDVEKEASLAGYKRMVEAEEKRRLVCSGKAVPQYLTDPSPHVPLRVEALHALRGGNSAQASAALDKAAELTPPLKGTLNDKPFTSIQDVDDVFSQVLEVMAHGNYFWVPLDQILMLTMNPPKFPRDLLWIPARLEMADARGEVFLPVQYPFSFESADDTIKLGRHTDWREIDGNIAQGIGAHTYLVGDDPVGILEWRALQIGE